MPWLPYLAYFFGGAFLGNSVPHLVAGMQGRPFQSPFAKPPGEGFSSSRVNVVWGFANLVVAYALLAWVGAFDIHALPDVGAAAAGFFLISFFAAGRFGAFNGGNNPTKQ